MRSGHFGAGLRCAAGGGGAGVEVPDIGGGAAAPGVVAGWRCEAEVAADFGDDVGDGAVGEVVFQVRVVQAVAQLGMEGFGTVALVCGAVDGILDGADDLAAGGSAAVGRIRCSPDGFVELAREGDAAPDGSGDAVEGRREGDEGSCGWLVRGAWDGVRRDSGVRGFGLADGLRVEQAGEAGAHSDEVVQGLAVPVRACCGLAGVVWCGCLGWVG